MTIKHPVALLATLALLGAAAAPASAAPTISYNATTGGLFTGTSGSDFNRITVSPGPAFTLWGAGTAGAGCTTTATDVACSLVRSNVITMRGDAGNDTLTAAGGSVASPITIWGEDGDDTLESYSGSPVVSYGGTGSDHIYANSNTASSYGGDGNDVQVTSSNGGGTTNGEGGNDILVAKSTALALDGGAGNDFLVFNSSNVPGGGGGAGTDVVISAKSGGSFGGGTEDDILAFGAGGAYCCGPVTATLHGNDGNDRLYGAPSVPATVYGDNGDDLIDTYGNGQADTVDCGANTDTAYVDATDTTSNCETVVVGSAAPADAQVTAAIADAGTYLSTPWATIPALP